MRSLWRCGSASRAWLRSWRPRGRRRRAACSTALRSSLRRPGRLQRQKMRGFRSAWCPQSQACVNNERGTAMECVSRQVHAAPHRKWSLKPGRPGAIHPMCLDVSLKVVTGAWTARRHTPHVPGRKPETKPAAADLGGGAQLPGRAAAGGGGAARAGSRHHRPAPQPAAAGRHAPPA